MNHRKGVYYWEDHRPKSRVWKGTMGGDVYAFSACQDYQKNIETKVKSAYIFQLHILVKHEGP